MANKQGDLGVFALVTELIRRNIEVSLPISDGGRYDLIAGNKKLYKIQVKEAWPSKRGAHIITNYSQNSQGKNKYQRKIYTKKEIDLLVGYIRETNDFYIIPVEETKGRNIICVWHTSKPKRKIHQKGWEKYINRFDLLA